MFLSIEKREEGRAVKVSVKDLPGLHLGGYAGSESGGYKLLGIEAAEAHFLAVVLWMELGRFVERHCGSGCMCEFADHALLDLLLGFHELVPGLVVGDYVCDVGFAKVRFEGNPFFCDPVVDEGEEVFLRGLQAVGWEDKDLGGDVFALFREELE